MVHAEAVEVGPNLTELALDPNMIGARPFMAMKLSWLRRLLLSSVLELWSESV